jgi:hypothetical protein
MNLTEQFKKKYEEVEVLEEGKSVGVIKALIDTDWSKDNEAQMKAVQLLKGIALSDEPEANAFMKKLDTFTSGMKVNEGFNSIASGKASELRKKLNGKVGHPDIDALAIDFRDVLMSIENDVPKEAISSCNDMIKKLKSMNN